MIKNQPSVANQLLVQQKHLIRHNTYPEMEMGNCFVCCQKLSLPTKLNVSCSCNIYGCLCCIRDYLKNFPVRICPICKKTVLNQFRSMSHQYVKLENEWLNDDSKSNECRIFDSTCRRCNAKLKNQTTAHKHLLTKCPNAHTQCKYCMAQVVRNRLYKKSKDSHFKSECVMRLCNMCNTFVHVISYKNHVKDDLRKNILMKIEKLRNDLRNSIDSVIKRYDVMDRNSQKFKQDVILLNRQHYNKYKKLVSEYKKYI